MNKSLPSFIRVLSCALLSALSAVAADQGIDPSALPRLAAIQEVPAPEAFAYPNGLIDTAALAKMLDTPGAKVVLLDARSDALFRQGHLPNARNLQSDLFQDPERGPYFMPPPEAIKRIAAQEGISAGTRVVVYDEDDGRLAARIWFTFYAHGHENFSILNGGLAKWRAERRSLSATAPQVDGSGTFEPLAVPRGVCSFDDLPRFKMRVHSMGKLPAVTLLDARTRPEYMGEEKRGNVAGHIPGAMNLPWYAVMRGKENERVWKSPQEIYALLRVSGVDKNVPTAVYDQAGGRSAHLFFTLWLLGFGEVRNYVGGWREYGGKAGVEVER